VEAFRIAFSSLVANRLRALLTTLGIIIGVGAVIGLISLGRGVEDFIASEFEGLGSNLLVVFASPPQSPTRERIQPISTVEAADILALDTIAAIAPIHGLQGDMILRRENVPSVTSFGVTPSYIEVRNYNVEFGRFIDQASIDNKDRVVALGWGVAEELYGEDVMVENFNPVGETVRFLNTTFEVIGVMEETSELAGENENVYIPISTSQQRLAPPFRARTRDGGYFLDALYIQAASEEVMDQAAREIETYLVDAHNIQFSGEEDFTVVNQSDLLESLGAITQNLTIFLSLIASTSLLVGGIGIMNIMLVSVTERTKEIGIRKAVGAKRSDILFQFLIEAVVLSLLGGFLGIGLGWLISVIGTVTVEQLDLSVQSDSIALATTVSVIVGVFFGLYPAWQASRKSPIDALRFE